ARPTPWAPSRVRTPTACLSHVRGNPLAGHLPNRRGIKIYLRGLGQDGGVGRHRRQERTDAFPLLFVCTGNICRSPFAEILTRHLLRGRLGGRAAAAFDVSSAGVAAVVGSAMHPDSRAELAPWGLDGAPADGFVARQLQSSMIE